jgi:hypothetical protein
MTHQVNSWLLKQKWSLKFHQHIPARSTGPSASNEADREETLPYEANGSSINKKKSSSGEKKLPLLVERYQKLRVFPSAKWGYFPVLKIQERLQRCAFATGGVSGRELCLIFAPDGL